MVSPRIYPHSGRRFGWLLPLLAVTLAAPLLLRGASAQTVVEVTLVDPPAQTISADFSRYAYIDYEDAEDDAGTLVVRDVESGEEVEHTKDEELQFRVDGQEIANPLLSADGSVVVVTACRIVETEPVCTFLLGDDDGGELTELDAGEREPGVAATLTADGALLYIGDGERYTIADETIEPVTFLEAICGEPDEEEELDARTCSHLQAHGPAGAWLSLAVTDWADLETLDAVQTRLLLVDTATGQPTLVHEVEPNDTIDALRITDVADDGDSATYFTTDGEDGAGYYLGRRGASDPDLRLALLPDDAEAGPDTTLDLECTSPAGAQLSDDGRFIAYMLQPEDGAFPSIYHYDTEEETVRLLTAAADEEDTLDGCTRLLAMAGDGQAILFASLAENLADAPETEPPGPLGHTYIARLTEEEPEEPEPTPYRAIAINVARTVAQD